MTVRVRIPAVLRGESGGQTILELATAEAATLATVLDQIARSWPLLERRLRDERGELRRYVNFYIDGEECRSLAGTATPVRPGAEVLVVPSVAGG